MSSLQHVSRVRTLYKAILRLHRSLPLEMRAMGDQYVKDEFRRHKQVNAAEAHVFMQEWTQYYLTLGKQLSARRKEQVVGTHLNEEFVQHFRDEQAEQLLELHDAIKNPQEGQNNEHS
ncbi:succinate dehydrogenase assembly factor 3, mitochondrial-like isoform X1 [Ostrea edulis]|uniref:succinate dehydrogenase assembly factor 3, mitochondrial-like isoform X1 n=1 Tax=Ostrea edulis TaxID=37623 RepID=UPI0024AEE9DE|nr:succinate dehydrogenase assembly factor 3, mitochondrial-like isoform X1 [Ostrea edulis]